MRYQTDNIAKDAALSGEIVRKFADVRALGPTAAVLSPTTTRAVVRRAAANPHTEAIVLLAGRPSLPIRNDTFEIPVADVWKARLYPTKSKIDRAIRSVGRIEVPDLVEPYQGTGWMIAPGIIVTNRHVALRFAQRGPGKHFSFRTSPFGEALTAQIDFHEEDSPSKPWECRILEIRYIAPDDPGDNSVPDIALVRIEASDGRPLPPPIPLWPGEVKPHQWVAAIGYPARDPFNPLDAQQQIFGNRFDVKRLAPGEVMKRLSDDLLTHDCSTLGGSSGSVVLDITTGAAAGIHFSGAYKDANYAFSVKTLRAALDGAAKVGGGAIVTTEVAPVAVPKPERTVTVTALSDRVGYRPDFLGTGDLEVPLPSVGPELSGKLAKQPASSGVPAAKRHLLHYLHYTAVVHATRRMAVYTASNIDGATAVPIKRGTDPWAFDPRIPKTTQVGNALYTNNDFDRGHLVRRLDPAWGADAKQAELDTFFYTNSTPQIHYFNDTLWGDLEDYLLENADTLDFKASIFTGPVLAENDPEYRKVQIPTAFWKVAVMVRADTGKLTATAYLVSQSDLLTHLEFAYGQFKTYQIPITRAEAISHLDFGSLRDFDPFVPDEGVAARELIGASDIRL